jgi:type IV pilus assembly protein PilM
MSLAIGVDIGSSSVTVAAVRRKGGSLSLEHYRHLSTKELGGPEPDRLARGLAAHFAQAGLKPRGCVLGVSGKDAIVRYSHLPPMPDWRLKLLMEFEIADVAERTGEPLSADYQVLHRSGEGSLVLVALAKDARVGAVVDAFAASGVEVSGAVPQPVATGDCFRYLGEGGVGVTLVVDIGHGSTEVALVEDDELLFARSVALGGEAFTERLTESLGVSRAEAEEIKRSGRAPGGEDLGKLLAVPRSQLASMVKASVDFARQQLKRPSLSVEQAAVAGGCARTPGLVEDIGRALGCEAALFDPLADLGRGDADRASREDAELHGPEAATALGLALSAVLPGASKLDLLPNAVKQQLEFKHRTLWLYVSAAVLALSLLVSFGLAGWEYSSESGRREQLDAALKELSSRVSAHEERVASNDKREADLQALGGRARPGLHLASLLATLGEATPPQISIGELELVMGSGGAFHFEATGLADDAQGEALTAMARLKGQLKAAPHVADVSLVPESEEGTARRFRLRVDPKGNPAPQEAP